MPFLSKKSKKKPEKTSDNIQLESKELQKVLNEKKETLRRLNLVKNYKSKVFFYLFSKNLIKKIIFFKNEIQNLDESIKKWTKAAQKAIEHLYSHYKTMNNTNANEDIPLNEFLKNLKVNLLDFKN